MKRLSTGVLAALMVTLCGYTAVAAPSATQGNTGNGVAQGESPPPANFGSPPSGQIPILYNDHHVYTKPDILKQGRVLAALVKGGALLIPLRSMFEQMGATVSWDAGSKTATVSKPGAEVKVTVGKPEVMINGESRPLDVPPMIYQGVVLVPVRVISEGMGAYVQWVPDRHLVVVRYIPATPPPSPAPPPSAAPPPPPPPPPPTPRPLVNELYVAGDYIFSPAVYNEFNAGNHASGGNGGYDVHGAATFSLGGLGFMIGANFERWPFPHNCSIVNKVFQPNCYVTVIGSNGSTPVVTTTNLNDQDVDARLGFGIAKWRAYVGGSYIWLTNNYGYPSLNGVGFGGERLPDLNEFVSFFGSVYYYPQVSGTASLTVPKAGGTQTLSLPLQYNLLKYEGGLTISIPNTPVFVEAGWQGTSWTNKLNAPVNRTYNGPFAGLGLKFLYP